ncbi:hypothetical protein DL771_004086 [Monosporascus sp. 5C6A]|nr:hypothetical protein DL771_004086 [Monosporascus sp. 5C6A]
MFTFHAFPCLPFELRQRIWELSMGPREVAVGRELARRLRTLPPPVLHACAESRSHLQRRYTKTFATGTPPRFSLVNFDIDTIYCSQGELEEFESDVPLIRWLIIESVDPDTFYYKFGHPLSDANALETLTILHIQPGIIHDEWWLEWDDIMEGWYFRDDPVRFYTRIIYPDHPATIEINPDNYLKVERDWRRKRVAEAPEDFGTDYEVSDSDDDVCAPGRSRTGWRHVDGCNCPSRRTS